MSDVATLPWEIQKVSFNNTVHTYFWLFTLSQKKTNCNRLAHPSWKCRQNTNLWNANWHLTSDWRFIVFLQMSVALNKPVVGWLRWLWKEPVVTCGNWNVKQTTSQQVFRVTTFYMNTCFQSCHWSVASYTTLCWNSAHVATSRGRNSSVSQTGTRYTRSSCSVPQTQY